jgi:hypothetical protein
VSWYQETEAFHINAMTLNWSEVFIYAFRPIPLLNKKVQKVINDHLEMILIIRFGQTGCGFPHS